MTQNGYNYAMLTHQMEYDLGYNEYTIGFHPVDGDTHTEVNIFYIAKKPWLQAKVDAVRER